jgi:hypothetical protein
MKRTIKLKTDKLELVHIREGEPGRHMFCAGIQIPLNIVVEDIENITYVFDKDFHGVKANKPLVWTYEMSCYKSTGFVSKLKIILSDQL